MRRLAAFFLAIPLFGTGCAPQSPPVAAPPVAAEIAPPPPSDTARPDLPGEFPVIARPFPDDRAKFVFAIIGDKTSGDARGWPVFDRAVDEVNLLRPDFAISIGDHVQGYTSDSATIARQWAEYRAHAGRLRVPFLLLPGNHDVTTPVLFAWWEREVGRTYYSFDWRGAHFLVLNTEHERFSGRWDFGDAQMAFVLDDLSRHADARHTFILMHKPAWAERSDGSYGPDWTRIEAALGARPYTIFAGHRHHVSYETRNGRPHVVLGPTGGNMEPSEVRRFGAFHHYTIVTVEGDSASVALVEPGGTIHPVDVAPRQFAEAAYRLARIEPRMPVERRNGEIATGFAVLAENRLSDSAAVTIALGGLGSAPARSGRGARGTPGWRLASGADSVRIVLGPGERRTAEFAFIAPADDLPLSPEVRLATSVADTPLFARKMPAPVFPDSAFRRQRSWHVYGPFPGADSAAARPAMAAVSAIESGRSAPGADSLRAKVRDIATARDGNLDLGAPFGSLEFTTAYAACTIESPRARRVWISLRPDDAAMLMVNGRLVANGRVFASDRRSDLVPLDLAKGRNVLVVRLANSRGGWGFRLRFVDPADELRLAGEER